MKRNRRYEVVGGILFLIVGMVFGLITGMNIGGNYFTSFQLGSARGYEATGYLGAIIGAVVGLLFGIWVGRRYAAKRVKE